MPSCSALGTMCRIPPSHPRVLGKRQHTALSLDAGMHQVKGVVAHPLEAVRGSTLQKA